HGADLVLVDRDGRLGVLGCSGRGGCRGLLGRFVSGAGDTEGRSQGGRKKSLLHETRHVCSWGMRMVFWVTLPIGAAAPSGPDLNAGRRILDGAKRIGKRRCAP